LVTRSRLSRHVNPKKRVPCASFDLRARLVVGGRVETVVLEGHNVAEALARFTVESGVHTLVLGSASLSWFRRIATTLIMLIGPCYVLRDSQHMHLTKADAPALTCTSTMTRRTPPSWCCLPPPLTETRSTRSSASSPRASTSPTSFPRESSLAAWATGEASALQRVWDNMEDKGYIG
ncbi:hypothetical protein ZWY2020_035279, partial [Hordeum vulgare]